MLGKYTPPTSQLSLRDSFLHPVAPPHGSQWPSCFSGSFCVCMAVYCILKGKYYCNLCLQYVVGKCHLLSPQVWSHHVRWVDSEITTPYQSLPGRVGSEAASSCSLRYKPVVLRGGLCVSWRGNVMNIVCSNRQLGESSAGDCC